MARLTDDERIAKKREELIKLEAARKAKQILADNAAKEAERKRRAQAISELGAALLACFQAKIWPRQDRQKLFEYWLWTGTDWATEKQWQRRQDALSWLAGQIGYNLTPKPWPNKEKLEQRAAARAAKKEQGKNNPPAAVEADPGATPPAPDAAEPAADPGATPTPPAAPVLAEPGETPPPASSEA